MRYNTSRDELNTTSYVPSRTSSHQTTRQQPTPTLKFIPIALTLITLAYYPAIVRSHHDFEGGIYRFSRSAQPETSFYLDKLDNYDTDQATQEFIAGSSLSKEIYLNQPTPPLHGELGSRSTKQAFQLTQISVDNPLGILPRRVRKHHELLPRDLFTPNIELRSSEPSLGDYQADSSYNLQPEDLVDSGSGSDNLEEIPGRQDEASLLGDHSPTPSFATPEQLMTPLLGQMPSMSFADIDNHGPFLARRIPKLAATAGSIWRYTLPSDIFQDDDGDLRQMKSFLAIKQTPQGVARNHGQASSSLDKLTHWLKYDHRTQTLLGFPMNSDIGPHSYTFTVSDRLGNTANETIEVTVRPHQSIRAFTHLFTLNGIELNPNGTSHIDILADIAKRIGEDVYGERSAKNVVVQSYNMTRKSPSSPTSVMSISWSNSSLPIDRCNLDSVIAPLVDDKYYPSWPQGSVNVDTVALSKGLIKALGPEYKPSILSINRRGICANISSELNDDYPKTANTGTNLKVKTRIGKLKWKLGQPIIYRIPDDVFVTDNETSASANITLSLHTIDGLSLDQDIDYNFLEFDQESRTIFGLPYEMTRDVGQKELLLTAKHNYLDKVVRETFIIDIEPQDLTTINNRAFKMSLYFMSRTTVFGAREQVHLSRRMINALEIQDLHFNHDQAIQDFTVIQIQKFRLGSSIDNSAALSDPSNAWRYHEKIQLVESDGELASSSGNQMMSYTNNNNEASYFYRLSWTNETIGHRGDCPVEVIKDNILYALERSMLDYVPPIIRQEDPNKNESVRFYERLRAYFEPELDLIHLRFEPVGACMDALELHDVGNSEVADMADRATEFVPAFEPETPPPHLVRSSSEEPKVKDVSPINSDEYWAIVVLIILVVAIIFVVMMLFLGLHTYRINQEKRFELQMKLAQARQNSMYLSSLMLADQVRPFDITGQLPQGNAKSMFIEERSSRNPVILDNEKQFLANGHMELPMQKPTAVQLTGHSIHTTPLKPNMTFTLDSMANMQTYNANIGPDTMMGNQMFIGNQQRSMTLNRRPVNNQAPMVGRKASMTNLSQSQSILTVASIGHPQLTMVPQPRTSFYPPLPTFYEPQDEPSGGQASGQ